MDTKPPWNMVAITIHQARCLSARETCAENTEIRNGANAGPFGSTVKLDGHIHLGENFLDHFLSTIGGSLRKAHSCI